MFEELRWACIALFTASIPLLVLARFKYSEFPAWPLIVLAIGLGWIFPYAYSSLWSPMIQEEEHARRAAEEDVAEEYRRHPPPPVRTPDGHYETIVENPYALVDYAWEEYHPVASLLYGPAYLMSCWLAIWLFLRRSASNQRRAILLVMGGVMLGEWIAIIGGLIKFRPPEIFSDGVLMDNWNLFFGPLTLPLAALIAWLVVAWLPTAFVLLFKRPIKGA
jgi:hypothetical protein